ncbi:hypothetical protein [Janthinobacterium agaricidamnosum]|uniref:Putative membrane protein n=1 Tax=Janthinobacterium agaricidamnosum NBRC 102515 = DSM 9628 TaxID=1349767 RepID=W0V586_9BURK|nr:hypothetical protein [Janthinobacterium agaricidamnosum]CDG83041.1 putative membrane protein [Janthinobacterium agaricidamnosum NBRC 102515 = DSM 9628]
MTNLRLAFFNTLRKHGWNALCAAVVIMMAHWLRAKRLDFTDVISALAVLTIYLAVATSIAYYRLRKA